MPLHTPSHGWTHRVAHVHGDGEGPALRQARRSTAVHPEAATRGRTVVAAQQFATASGNLIFEHKFEYYGWRDRDPGPAHATGVHAGGFPSGDLTLLRFFVDHALAADTSTLSETELIDQIQEIETLQASLAALQTDRIRAFAQAHVDSHRVDDRADVDKLHRSVVAQIQLPAGSPPPRPAPGRPTPATCTPGSTTSGASMKPDSSAPPRPRRSPSSAATSTRSSGRRSTPASPPTGT
jgi:hypothetical protein